MGSLAGGATFETEGSGVRADVQFGLGDAKRTVFVEPKGEFDRTDVKGLESQIRRLNLPEVMSVRTVPTVKPSGEKSVSAEVRLASDEVPVSITSLIQSKVVNRRVRESADEGPGGAFASLGITMGAVYLGGALFGSFLLYQQATQSSPSTSNDTPKASDES